jgi:hypothetical protein
MTVMEEYRPIEPGPVTPTEVESLRSQWAEQALRFRAIATIYLVIGAWGGLSGGIFLTRAYSNWLTWSIALLILEPIGVVCLASLIFIHWPNSGLGVFLGGALQRAKLALLIVGVIFAGGILTALLYLAGELWRLR